MPVTYKRILNPTAVTESNLTVFQQRADDVLRDIGKTGGLMKSVAAR